MKFDLDKFFENLKEEKIFSLFEKFLPWEIIKKLKEYLLDIVPELPSTIPIKTPIQENLFISLEREVIPLKEIKEKGGRYFFRGENIKGAILFAGCILMDRKIFFEDGVIVEPYALIQGPAYFSEKTQIRHTAYIRGSVYTGKNAVIGHTTEVKNSIFLSSAKAAHFAYIGDSILGKDVNLGAGTKLANLKFTKKEITFIINKEKVYTKLKKFGAIIGDRCQTGCNSVLQPGTLIGKDSFVFPGVVGGPGYFPPKSKLK